MSRGCLMAVLSIVVLLPAGLGAQAGIQQPGSEFLPRRTRRQRRGALRDRVD